MLNVAVLVSGNGSNLHSIIKALHKGDITNCNLSIVISSKNEAYALNIAKENNIDSIAIIPKNFNSAQNYEYELIKILRLYKVDLIVLAGFTTILTKTFTNEFKNMIINVHPSLIPEFCGKGFYGIKIHEQVIKNKCKITGATVHYVNEIVDGGDIILQKEIEVFEQDTPEILQKRVMEYAEWKILPKAINLICNNKLQEDVNYEKKSIS